MKAGVRGSEENGGASFPDKPFLLLSRTSGKSGGAQGRMPARKWRLRMPILPLCPALSAVAQSVPRLPLHSAHGPRRGRVGKGGLLSAVRSASRMPLSSTLFTSVSRLSAQFCVMVNTSLLAVLSILHISY